MYPFFKSNSNSLTQTYKLLCWKLKNMNEFQLKSALSQIQWRVWKNLIFSINHPIKASFNINAFEKDADVFTSGLQLHSKKKVL